MRRNAFIDRLRGIPRSLRELNRGLQMLASLRSLGWQRSATEGSAQDENGQPLPWYTYATVAWLEPRLRATDRVFEFGAGSSTLWYATRVRSVRAVEHDYRWFQYLQHRIPNSVELMHRQSDVVGRATGASPLDRIRGHRSSLYVKAIEEASSDNGYDVVVVDGLERVACAEASADYVAIDGLIVLDDSHRPEYRSAVELLSEAGFSRIDLTGFKPGIATLGTTSLFARDLSRWLRPMAHLKDWGT